VSGGFWIFDFGFWIGSSDGWILVTGSWLLALGSCLLSPVPCLLVADARPPAQPRGNLETLADRLIGDLLLTGNFGGSFAGGGLGGGELLLGLLKSLRG